MVFGVASAFPTSPEMLLAFRFLSGTGLMGLMVSGFVLGTSTVAERVTPDRPCRSEAVNPGVDH